MSEKDNIIKYHKKRKKITVNAAVIFFAVIFIYVLAMIIRSYFAEKVSVYEVVDGSISDKTYYSGIILRDEFVNYAPEAGVVNYYVRDKSKISINNLIYTIDKDGALSEAISNSIEKRNAELSTEELNKLKASLSEYMLNFSESDFSDVYSINESMSNALHTYVEDIVRLSGKDVIANIDAVYSEHLADISGIVCYYVDGYEELTTDKVTPAHFEGKNYNKKNLPEGKKISLWDPVYKVVKSDEWSVIFKPNKNELERLSELSMVTVHFDYNDIETKAKVSLFNGMDGNVYAELSMDKYMSEFITDRFIDFNICYEETSGLKIPKSSVVTKNVLKIPVQYVTYGGSGQSRGFMKEVTAEDGSSSVQFVTGTIYREDDFYFYIDCEELELGDILIKEGASNDRYEICLQETIEGVYAVNKGYAVFKRIYTLGEMDDYYIVMEGIRKGVSKYDHIALIGSKISEDEIIY